MKLNDKNGAVKERTENSCPATDYSRYLCELICTVYENCDDCPYKEQEDEDGVEE